jgi:hypothetical protein
VSGDITVAEADLPAVAASTVSGRLRLQTRLGEGPYRFNSVSGDVYLLVPAGTRCAAALHSQSGRVHRGVPGTPPGAAEAGDRPEVRLNSVSGDLWLLGPADAPEPPARPTRDRRAVLERVSRGELSVEDAAQFLKAP